MPELKSKKSGKTWKDAQSFYNDYIQVDPSAKNHSPDDLWEAARTSGGYDFIDDAPQPAATQPPPTAAPSKPFSFGNMLRNLPGSFAKQAQDMGTGAVAAFKYLDPFMINPTGNMYAQAVRSINENGVGGATQSGIQTASNVLGAVKDQYKDRYFNGKFLENLENDPAAIAADVASFVPVAGWAAKTAGMAKTAKALNKAAYVADAFSSPIPAAAQIVGRAPMVANKVARSGMTYSLQLPKEMHANPRAGARRLPSQADKLASFALDNGINAGASGQRKADKLYVSSLDEMKKLESQATQGGIPINPTEIESTAKDLIAKTNRATPEDLAAAHSEVDRVLKAGTNFPDLTQPYSPNHAADVRARLNASTPPEPNVLHTPASALRKKAEVAVGHGVRQELARKIPGHRDASIRSMQANQVGEAIQGVKMGRANGGIIEHANSGSLGLAAGNIIKGKVFSPIVMGLGAKTLHGPEIVSSIATKIHSKSPTSLRKLDLKTRKGAQPVGQALKQVGKPNPLRPFAEDDEPQQVNPLRPFPEE